MFTVYYENRRGLIDFVECTRIDYADGNYLICQNGALADDLGGRTQIVAAIPHSKVYEILNIKQEKEETEEN